jgi:predicted ATP-dependent protease
LGRLRLAHEGSLYLTEIGDLPLPLQVKLLTFLDDKSRIVKTFSMQALADLAQEDEVLRREANKIITDLVESGSPAMKSRGKKLLKQLKG